MWPKLLTLLNSELILSMGRAAIVLVLGLILMRALSASLGRLFIKRMSPQQVMILRRASAYMVLGLTLVIVLKELGFDLSVLLGAAGIFTVALGFASQTTASNLISGLFLIGERSFELGQVIQVGQTTGEVLSIDMLSVKIRTFDNLYVRLPNETLLKSEIINLSKHPIRRIDTILYVSYETDLEALRTLLLQIMEENPLALAEPNPTTYFLGFGESSMQVRFSVWTASENVFLMRSAIAEVTKKALDRAGIAYPYPRSIVELKSPPASAGPPGEESEEKPPSP